MKHSQRYYPVLLTRFSSASDLDFFPLRVCKTIVNLLLLRTIYLKILLNKDAINWTKFPIIASALYSMLADYVHQTTTRVVDYDY